MMEKDPEKRYRSPQEAMAALTAAMEYRGNSPTSAVHLIRSRKKAPVLLAIGLSTVGIVALILLFSSFYGGRQHLHQRHADPLPAPLPVPRVSDSSGSMISAGRNEQHGEAAPELSVQPETRPLLPPGRTMAPDGGANDKRVQGLHPPTATGQRAEAIPKLPLPARPVTMPHLETEVKPVFPSALDSTCIGKILNFSLIIDERGKVASSKIISENEAPHCGEVIDAVKAAVMQYGFTPAVDINGKPVRAVIALAVKI